MNEPEFEFKIITSDFDLRELFEFRYKIYFQEMRRFQLDADHESRVIRDRLDNWGRNFVVRKNGRIVAAIRGNFFRDGHDDKYESLYQPQSVGEDHPSKTCMVTRLMIDSDLRGSPLVLDLFLWLYSYAIDHDLNWILLDCNDWLINFFQRFGFLEYRGKVEHEEYGLVTPMRVNLKDEKHLRAVDSPYLPLLLARKAVSELNGSQ